jgi:hypothetical protein
VPDVAADANDAALGVEFDTNLTVVEVSGGLPSRGPPAAQCLFDTGRVPEGDRYVVSQGAVLGRRGRVYIERDGEGTIWVGGGTVSCIEGIVDL